MKLLGNGDHVILTRAQRGWLCDVAYSVATDEQFTNVMRCYRADGRWWWSALFKGWLGARKEKRHLEKVYAPGRVAKGW
jgi:hypothetical protein